MKQMLPTGRFPCLKIPCWLNSVFAEARFNFSQRGRERLRCQFSTVEPHTHSLCAVSASTNQSKEGATSLSLQPVLAPHFRFCLEIRKASYSPISLRKRGPGNCILSEEGQQMLCMGHSIPGVLYFLHESRGCGGQSRRQLDTQLGKSYSKWWGVDMHLPMDRHSSRSSSLLSSCPLWGETTLTRKYTWQKGEATCRYWTHACCCLSLLTSAVIGPLLACPVFSPMLCYQEKIGDPHQQWLLPHFLGRLPDHYSLSDIKNIYYSPSMTTADLLTITLLLYSCERAFHLKSVVVPSC